VTGPDPDEKGSGPFSFVSSACLDPLYAGVAHFGNLG
jgi:hypothetical protein